MLDAVIAGNPVSKIPEKTKLINVLTENDFKVKQLCGRRGRCATCHVYVNKNEDALTPQTEQERLTLSILTGAMPNSRLACQCSLVKPGLEISVPSAIYYEGDEDIEPLIGKRAPANILHPISGEVLIEEGKLIVRSIITDLKAVQEEIKRLDAASNK